LAHGGGGRYSHQLIDEVFLSVFGNDYLTPLDDSAVIGQLDGPIAFTTDSFTVEPIFFPGGDIGKLAVCGTVNDLSMVGAKPRFLSIGFIIEEGYPLNQLKQIVQSIQNTADEADVLIVTGDTKVVQRGKADGVFINTSGIGEVFKDVSISASNAKPGDAVIVNGPIGCHGMAVVTSREGFGFTTRIESDVAPLNHLVENMIQTSSKVHVLRDATRGGLATVLNEIAQQSKVEINLDEKLIPIPESVRGACELLGFDPLYVANEGVLAAIVPGEVEGAVLQVMKKKKYGKESAVIGRVVNGNPGRVTLKTQIGSHRILDMLSGEQLPRIC